MNHIDLRLEKELNNLKGGSAKGRYLLASVRRAACSLLRIP